MTKPFRLKLLQGSRSSTPSWPEHHFNAAVSCGINNTLHTFDDRDIETASDYGSDFTSEEQDLLNELLDSFGSNTSAIAHNPSAIAHNPSVADLDVTASQEIALNDLHNNLPAPGIGDSKDIEVTDIEDYESKGLRVSNILGKKRWAPPHKKTTAFVQLPETAAGPANRGNTNLENPESRDRSRKQLVSTEPALDPSVRDTRSPLERFRKAPKKALSVTDLVSPAWCEMQYFYSLSKHGRKRRTPAMKQGTAIHKIMEGQVHTTVPVEVTTVEDAWGLKFWNMIQGLRTLRETGITREFEIWGIIDGEIINGIIDELSYDCPDPGLEAFASTYYANAQADKEALPESQMSITEYFVKPFGQPINSIGHTSSTPSGKVYLTDLKTRTVPSLPSGISFRPTQMQLSLYHYVLSTMTAPSTAIPLSSLAARYLFSPDTPFTDAFIAQVNSLDDIFLEHMDSDLPSTHQSFSSQDSLALLTSHPTLASLYTLLLTQFHATFPQGAASISPVLTASYRLGKAIKIGQEAKSSDFENQKSFLFDRTIFDSYVQDEMRWWKGERETKGVDIDEAWKCQSCEFRDECVWIAKRQDELLEMKTVGKRSAKSAV